jgi:ketosteroid isomerase-like protein
LIQEISTVSEATTVVTDHADTGEFDADQAAIWAEQKAMYAAFLAGDRARIDRWIHPTATIWDGVDEQIARGLDDLNRIRAERPIGAAAPVVTELSVEAPVVTVFGDTAIGRHVLKVTSTGTGSPATSEVVRVSSAWHRFDGEWWLVHSHEDIHSTGTGSGIGG